MERIKDKLILLVRIAMLFNQNEIRYGLGASAMLYLRGLVDDFNDLDIMVLKEDSDKAVEILRLMGEEALIKRSPDYASKHFHKLMIDGVEVDLLGDFIICKDGVEYDMSLAEECNDSFCIENVKIPLCDLDHWKKCYELMGRSNKVKLIADYQIETSKRAIYRDFGILLKGIIPMIVMGIGIVSGIFFRNKRK